MAWLHSPVLCPRPCQPKGLLSACRELVCPAKTAPGSPRRQARLPGPPPSCSPVSHPQRGSFAQGLGAVLALNCQQAPKRYGRVPRVAPPRLGLSPRQAGAERGASPSQRLPCTAETPLLPPWGRQENSALTHRSPRPPDPGCFQLVLTGASRLPTPRPGGPSGRDSVWSAPALEPGTQQVLDKCGVAGWTDGTCREGFRPTAC